MPLRLQPVLSCICGACPASDSPFLPRNGIATANDLPACLGAPVHLDGDVGEPIDRARQPVPLEAIAVMGFD